METENDTINVITPSNTSDESTNNVEKEEEEVNKNDTIKRKYTVSVPSNMLNTTEDSTSVKRTKMDNVEEEEESKLYIEFTLSKACPILTVIDCLSKDKDKICQLKFHEKGMSIIMDPGQDPKFFIATISAADCAVYRVDRDFIKSFNINAEQLVESADWNKSFKIVMSSNDPSEITFDSYMTSTQKEQYVKTSLTVKAFQNKIETHKHMKTFATQDAEIEDYLVDPTDFNNFYTKIESKKLSKATFTRETDHYAIHGFAEEDFTLNMVDGIHLQIPVEPEDLSEIHSITVYTKCLCVFKPIISKGIKCCIGIVKLLNSRVLRLSCQLGDTLNGSSIILIIVAQQ